MFFLFINATQTDQVAPDFSAELEQIWYQDYFNDCSSETGISMLLEKKSEKQWEWTDVSCQIDETRILLHNILGVYPGHYVESRLIPIDSETKILGVLEIPEGLKEHFKHACNVESSTILFKDAESFNNFVMCFRSTYPLVQIGG